MSTTRPAAPPPPAPAAPTQKRSPRATIPKPIALNLTSGKLPDGDRIGIFGTGGIGKTTLAAALPGAVFLDAEKSTSRIASAVRDAVSDWTELRGKAATLASSPPDGLRSVVVDTATTVEEFAKEHVIATRTTDKGKSVDSIEGFGWGKGWQYVYEEFTGLLADLDRIAEKGVNVCLIMHDVDSPAPNPAGEDYPRWEPLLYAGDKKGRGSIRARVKNWTDHLLFIGYDVHVEDGKGRGSGTRSIYTEELPTHIAKSREWCGMLPFEEKDPGAIWRKLGIK